MSIEYIKKNSRHHAFYRSDYFEEDRDEEWNMFDLDYDDHRCIHHASTNKQIRQGREVAKICREIAFKRYEGKYKKKLEQIMRERAVDKKRA